MEYSNEKKEEYWNHFINTPVCKCYKCPSLTKLRLEKLKIIVWNDSEFWGDILLRHDGNRRSPEQMKMDGLFNYEHCMGNFGGMLIQTLIRNKMVKI